MRQKTLAVCGFWAGVLFLGACGTMDVGSPERKNSRPDVQLSSPQVFQRYNAYYLAPIEVYSLRGGSLERAEQSEVDDLTEQFRVKLIRQLDNRYTTFPQPARNVAQIRITLADVTSTSAAFQMAPGILLPNLRRGGASMQAEFIDSITKERLALVRDTREGERQGYFSGLGKWDGVERAFDEWAKMLDATIEQ